MIAIKTSIGTAIVASVVLGLAAPVSAQSLPGVWRVLSIEDVRDDGSVARYPYGKKPHGFIVAEGGWCSVQIMATETPTFVSDKAIAEQMKSAILSNYLSYSGPCTVNEAEKSLTIRIEARWRPEHVGAPGSVTMQACCAIGSEQKRFYKFEGDKLVVSPAPRRDGNVTITRRVVMERAKD